MTISYKTFYIHICILKDKIKVSREKKEFHPSTDRLTYFIAFLEMCHPSSIARPSEGRSHRQVKDAFVTLSLEVTDHTCITLQSLIW
jgi:hypothetical protein